MNDFPYSMGDVLQMENIPVTGRNMRIRCPFCSHHGKTFGVNLDNEIYNCFVCHVSGRGATRLYADLHDISTKDAHKQILHYLGKDGSDFSNPIERKPLEFSKVENSETATEEKRDIAYKKLFEFLPLEDEDKAELISRGFNPDEIAILGYGTYPYKGEELCMPYLDIPKKIESDGISLKGIPGFFKTKNGNTMMQKIRSGIAMPCVGFHRNIKSVQIRVRNSLLEEGEGKCRWMSTPYANKGSKMCGNIHYAVDFHWNKEKQWFEPVVTPEKYIALTEGIMKADLLHILADIPVISVPGVGVLNELLEELKKLREIGYTKVIDCYDMDYKTNPNVLKDMERLKEIVSQAGLIYERIRDWDTKTDDGVDCLKGIDDYYAYKVRNITPYVK